MQEFTNSHQYFMAGHAESAALRSVSHAAQAGMQELDSGHQKVKWAHWTIVERVCVRVKSFEEQTSHGEIQVCNCGHQV